MFELFCLLFSAVLCIPLILLGLAAAGVSSAIHALWYPVGGLLGCLFGFVALLLAGVGLVIALGALGLFALVG
jgi:hypothetical protein